MSSIISAIGSTTFQLAFGVSPIIFKDGIAKDIPMNLLPIVVITEAIGLVNGLISGAGGPKSLDESFAQFVPVPGGTLLDNEIAHYPFENLSTAANAVVTNPLTVSLRMIAPARKAGDYVAKLATMTALQAALNLHTALGGTYIVALPYFIYTGMLLKRVTDITSADTRQTGVEWQWDFEQPQITAQTSGQALNNLMTQITSGLSGAGSALSGAANGILGMNIPSLSSVVSSL